MSPALLRLLVFLLLIGNADAADPAELYQAGRYQEAVTELQTRLQQLGQLTPKTPDDELEIARTKHALGMSLLRLGKEEAALSEFEEATQQYISLEVGANAIALSLDILARAQHQAGHLTDAEASFRESLAWRERDQSDDSDYWKGITTDHLGLLHLTAGDYRSAGRILNQSLANTPSDQTALLAQRHHYLGRYLHSIRNFHRAAEHAQKSLEYGRTVAHLDLASYLDLLALALYRSGDQAGAEAALLEALELLRQQPVNLQRAQGEAEILNKVGEFALQTEPALAQASFQEALDGLLAWLPADHPSLAAYHNNLGLAAMFAGDHPTAEEQFQCALDLLDQKLQGLEFGHQRRAEWKQNLAWNSLLAGDTSETSSLVTAASDEAQAVLHQLLTDGTERERLNFLARFDLFSLPAAAGEGELLHTLLANNKGLLLDTLISKQDTPTASDSTPQTLPQNAVFIDFIRYRKPTLQGWTHFYGAIIEPVEGPVQFIPLAEERVLLRWLKVIEERLSYRALVLAQQEVEPPVLRLEAALRTLHKQFLAPILDSLTTDPSTLVICPDGALHFLPFASLLDEEGTFFSSAYPQVLFVSSRRDLNSQAPTTKLTQGRWALFGIGDYQQAAITSEEPWFLENLTDLPHVEHELQSLEKMAPPGSQTILNPKNPETALKNLSPDTTVLHLAAHAFFKEPQSNPGLLDLDAQPEVLLSSGLALSGPAGENDGILYPHEIAQLSLSQAQLVSLSACHTGLGTPLAGEGVLGLRRAFALAGARTLLLTLWQVPDRSTAAFMTTFYQDAQRSDNPSFTLWHLQGKLLQSDARPRNDAALEEAVLRHGPFLITHRGPIPEIPNQTSSTPRETTFHWGRYLLWLIVLALVMGTLFLLSKKKKTRLQNLSHPTPSDRECPHSPPNLVPEKNEKRKT